MFTRRRIALLALLAGPLVAFSLLGGCTVREEVDHQNQLGSTMRVLALRSVPAEIPLGETGRLSALIYTPGASSDCADDEISYEWSWCPLRGAGEDGFGCALSEREASELWATLGGEIELPPYDLGTEPEVDYLNVFGDFAVAACSMEVDGTDESSQLELYNCVESRQVSVRLDVSWCGQKRSAVKALSLMGEDETSDDTYAPNQNPDPSGTMTLSPDGDPSVDLGLDDALEAGETYNMSIELDDGGACDEDDPPEDCVAELFAPEPIPGITDEEERRERLVLSWYVSKGNTAPRRLDGEEYQPDTDSNGGQDTFFNENEETIDGMLGNILSFEDDGPGEGEVIVVLRDERGGVGWARFPFTVEDAE